MSANRVCEVLDQQEKLKEMKEKLKGVMEKINQSINSITVSSMSIKDNQRPIDNKPSFYLF